MANLSDFVSGGGDTSGLAVNVIGQTSVNQTLDLSQYTLFEFEPTGALTVSVTGLADSNLGYLTVTNGGSYTVSWGSSFKWKAGSEPVLNSGAWDLSTASYDSVSFSVGGQDVIPYGIHFKPDGTKMYMLGNDTDSVYQYTLSTAWDLSTASYDSVSFSVGGQDVIPFGIHFKPDGTKMYMLGGSNDSVYQYTLSTAWDLSTASYDSVSFSVSGQDANPFDIHFKPDGTKMYMVGINTDSVHQYTLSTAWDLSTASYDSVSFSVSGQDTSPYGIDFKPDGTKMYMVGDNNNSVYQYTLSTAWDLSTASYDSVSFSVSGQDANPFDTHFKPDGTKMYMLGNDTDSVYQYTIPDLAYDHILLTKYDASTVLAEVVASTAY